MYTLYYPYYTGLYVGQYVCIQQSNQGEQVCTCAGKWMSCICMSCAHVWRCVYVYMTMCMYDHVYE